MNYRNAIEQVLKHEGGFVNHPADKGGATNWGITQRVYEEYLGRKVSLDEMKNMPKSDAIAIYKRNYWDAINGDKINLYAIAFAIFDQAVNRGVTAAVKQAQNIVGVKSDGIPGPATINAINAISERDFLNQYLTASLDAYQKIAAKPGQEVFLKGWTNRVNSLDQYVMSYLGTMNRTTAISGGLIATAGIFFLIYQLTKSPKRRLA